MSKYDPKYFVELDATHPRCSDAFPIVARISDGQFVRYPRDLVGWPDATNVCGLVRDGFTIKPCDNPQAVRS